MTGSSFCYQTSNIWQVVGYFFAIFKIVIPILLIIFGMLDLGKAVVSSKDGEIKKSTSSLVRRVIAGICIYFLPTIVTVIFNLVTDSEIWKPCLTCITHPSDSACINYQECTEDVENEKCNYYMNYY